MEENEKLLRGKQIVWHKEIKEQVFGDDEYITVKRISEKISNMKKASSWKEAKAMQTHSGAESS